MHETTEVRIVAVREETGAIQPVVVIEGRRTDRTGGQGQADITFRVSLDEHDKAPLRYGDTITVAITRH